MSNQGKNPINAVNVAVSSRALFDTGIDYNWTEEPHKFDEYLEEIAQSETKPFAPGAAFTFVQVREWYFRPIVLYHFGIKWKYYITVERSYKLWQHDCYDYIH